MKSLFRETFHALAATILFVGCVPSLADPAKVDAKTVIAAPEWITGSTWYYSDGYSLRVSSTTPAATVFDRLDAPGQWFSRQGFLRKDLTSGTATRTSVFRTIPDQAGLALHAGDPLTFQREYLENGSLMVHASSWSVEGRETVTVPAGTFDCWIIVWRSRSLQSNWTGFERWWYSPQTQNYVRMEYKYGADAEGSRVLMRYQIGAHTAENAPETVVSAPVQIAVAEPAAAAPEPANGPPTPVALPLASSQVEKMTATAPPPVIVYKPPTVAAPIASVVPPAAVSGENVWHAQLASSKEEGAVRKSLAKLLRDHADILKELPSGISSAQIANRGVFFRAWVGRFDRAAAAVALCGNLRVGGAACSVSKSQRGEEETG